MRKPQKQHSTPTYSVIGGVRVGGDGELNALGVVAACAPIGSLADDRVASVAAIVPCDIHSLVAGWANPRQ